MTEKEQAMAVMMFIYNELSNEIVMYNSKQDIPSKPVSKMLKQIKTGMRHLINTNSELYETLRLKVNEAKVNGINKVVRVVEGKYVATKEDILTMFWDRLNRNPYQEIWVTERTVVAAINSLSQAKERVLSLSQRESNDDVARENARKLIRFFLDDLGIKQNNGLATRKKIIELDKVYG